MNFIKDFLKSELGEKVKKLVGKYLEPKRPKTHANPDDYFAQDSMHNPWYNYLQAELQRKTEDATKYEDYDLMDAEIPEISAALDIIADYVVYPDSVNDSRSFTITSNKYQKQIDEIFKITQFEKMFHSIVRGAIKYGDNIEELVANKADTRIVLLKHVPIDSVVVHMKNGVKQTSPMIKQFDETGKELATLSSAECLQFSIPIDRKRYVTCGKGVSLIEKSRLLYRQLRLMEEGMIINRLSKSNNNYAVIVDVGDLTGDEALDYLEKYRRKIQRKKYIDPATGRMTLKLNPLSAVEDIFVPTRQGSGGNVIPLNQNLNRGTIEDIEYMQNKLIYSTGVPKILIGKEDDVNSKSSTDVQYISFLRKIRMLQKWFEPEIIRFFEISLRKMGIKNPGEIKIDWPIYGTIDEERRWKIELIKLQVASILGKDTELVDDYWIYKNILLMNDEQITELTTRMDEAEQAAIDEYEANMDDAVDKSDKPIKDYEDEEDESDYEDDEKKRESLQKGMMELYKETLSPEQYKKVTTMLKDDTCQKMLVDFMKLTKLLYNKV